MSEREHDIILTAIEKSEGRQSEAIKASEIRVRSSIRAVHKRLDDMNGRQRTTEKDVARQDERLKSIERRGGVAGGAAGGAIAVVAIAGEWLWMKLTGGG